MQFALHENEWYSVNDDIDFSNFFTNKLINTNKHISYFNDVLAFDIETSSFNEYTEAIHDTEVYDYLLGTKIKISQQFYTDIPDFNSFRKQLFGRIYFSKSDGIAVDVLYRELLDKFPYYFKDDIINPSDILEKILEVFYQQSPVKEDQDSKRGLMYVWQLAINGHVIIGRTWKEFIDLMQMISDHFRLSKDRRMVCFIHNLSFEMSWLQCLFKWEKVFAIKAHKPIYALSELGIEFRCSYLLSNMSLANVGLSLKKYKCRKLDGNKFNYELIRHNKTPLTSYELRYCCHDVLVLSGYIKECMQAETGTEEGDITKLPLTATGYCRRHMREKALSGPGRKGQHDQFKKYNGFIKYMTMELPEYELAHRAFLGGYSVAGALHSTNIMHNLDSQDLTSAYPGAMVLFSNYPMSKGKKVEVHTIQEFERYIKLKCCIFDIRFIDLKPKLINANYLSLSKCRDEFDKPFRHTKENDNMERNNIIVQNGRIVSGDVVATSMTDVDYRICKDFYTWSRIEIGCMYVYTRGRLPKEIVEAVLDLYAMKTTLKGSTSEYDQDMYARSKNLLNSCYGMICQRVIQDVHYYDNEKGWCVEEKDKQKELDKYNKSKKRFLFYPWSLYVTANVREVITSGLIYGAGDRFCYADTDSLKYCAEGDITKCENWFKTYNQITLERAKEAAAFYNIPLDKFMPKTKKGEHKLIMEFEKETAKGKWPAFISLGSKRYLYLTADHELILTVSGVNKKVALPYLINKYGKYGTFKYFNEHLIIPPDHTGKLTHYYLNGTYEGEVEDYLGNRIKYKSTDGIYLEKTSYSFSMEATYLNYLREIQESYIYEVY